MFQSLGCVFSGRGILTRGNFNARDSSAVCCAPSSLSILTRRISPPRALALIAQLGAPKGIGGLFIRTGFALSPIFLGGGQEGGRRAGTEPVPLIVALGAACHAAKAGLHSYANHTAEVTARLRERLVAALPAGATLVHGPANDAHRLPNTLRCAPPPPHGVLSLEGGRC